MLENPAIFIPLVMMTSLLFFIWPPSGAQNPIEW